MATNPQTPDKSKAAETQRARTFARDYFPTIRAASLTFVVCVLLGAAMVSATQQLLERQISALRASQLLENSSRAQFRQVEVEKHEIHDFQPMYQQLVMHGFVGAEQRLNWIDSIQAIQQTAHLQPLNYEIAEQQAFVVAPSIDMGGLEVRGSKMLIKLSLLHEMDLFRLLNGIKSDQLFDLQNCVIKRWPEPDPGTFLPLLYAECTLYWLTVGKAGGEPPDTDTSMSPTVPGA